MGRRPRSCSSCNRCSACCGLWPFSHAFFYVAQCEVDHETAKSIVLHESDAGSVVGMGAKKLCCDLEWVDAHAGHDHGDDHDDHGDDGTDVDGAAGRAAVTFAAAAWVVAVGALSLLHSNCLHGACTQYAYCGPSCVAPSLVWYFHMAS